MAYDHKWMSAQVPLAPQKYHTSTTIGEHDGTKER